MVTRLAHALIGLGAAWLLASCGDDDGMGPDDAPPADGILTFDAAQLRRDASRTPDGARPDASIPDLGADAPVVDARPPLEMGPSTGECVLPITRTSFGPLDPECKPRCSAATAAAYAMCTNNACREDVTAADTSIGERYTVNDIPNSTALDCFACFDYSRTYCNRMVCPDEVDAYADYCIFGIDEFACDTAIDLMNVCLTALTTAQRSTLATCFATYDGPMGCFVM